MIDVNDLMCGNWVNDTVLGKVIVLNNLPYSMDLSHTEGIPVTVDMLKRIGFEKYTAYPLKRRCYKYWDKDRRYKLEVCDDEDWCNSDRRFTLFVDNSRFMSVGSAEFTYVHELQNLVRIISGFSLPITEEMLYE